MKALPTEFAGIADQKGPPSVGRYMFKQLKRVGDVALFQKHNPKHPPGTAMSYEVVIVQKVDEVTWPDGMVTAPHEAMPSPEQWGIAGWSPLTLADAEKRFAATVESRANGA